jgi:hypothetical protein
MLTSGRYIGETGCKKPLTCFALSQIVLVQRLPQHRFYHCLPAYIQFTGYAIKLLKHLNSEVYIDSLCRWRGLWNDSFWR